MESDENRGPDLGVTRSVLPDTWDCLGGSRSPDTGVTVTDIGEVDGGEDSRDGKE